MGYIFTKEALNALFNDMRREYRLIAHMRCSGEGEFSESDSIRYTEVTSVQEIELNEKSRHAFKEGCRRLRRLCFSSPRRA